MAAKKTTEKRTLEQSEASGVRELIVVSRPELTAFPSDIRTEMASSAALSFSKLVKQVIGSSKRTKLVSLFEPTVLEESLTPDAFTLGLADVSPLDLLPMSAFHSVIAPEDELEEIAKELTELDVVEAAYIKPPAMPASLNEMAPCREEPPSLTPDFTSRQLYLNPAPEGIDAKYAWKFHGGRGDGIRIIDCEWGWRFTHEDLQSHTGGVVVGTPSTEFDNHGTAVLGEYSGDANSFGIVGICSNAHASAASFQKMNTATVIQRAANKLTAGDILLLEIHRPGPDASGSGQDGYIAIEWWPDDLAAIRYAVSRGIIVVEAAGNGGRNLDAHIYENRPTGFPLSWRNPFNPANPTSGAVVVGAGAPPPGTHGRDHGPDRSRLGFSNYGRRIDAQGWGREVTTTGYGDLQGGANRDLWYTDQFSGTSSASPIVVGALGCVQGILKARKKPLLTSGQAISLLRSTGSPQQDAPSRPRTQRIGNRPDLRELIPAALGEPTSPAVTSSQPASKVRIQIGNVTVTIESNSGSVDLEDA